MKKVSIILLIFILMVTPLKKVYADDYNEEDEETEKLELIETVAPVDSEVKINSRAAIIYERNTGTVLYEKNADVERPMASTTKIMSAIITLENADLNQIVTISSKAANTGGSTINLKTGDKITVHDLLCGLMIKSGNDAAVALAETIGGSVEGFANMMNKKAEELGLEHTHFVTPHGLDNDNHYTTAKELAILTDYALNIPKFREIVKTSSYILTINGKERTINNTNELLGYLHGVYGVKTGFTGKAGRCLVTATKRENMDIICVVLGADTKKMRSQDSMKLIEYAFKNFQLLDLKNMLQEAFEKENIERRIEVIKAKESVVKVELQNKPTVIAIRTADIPSIEIEVNYTKKLTAPVPEKYRLGNICARIDDNILFSQDILLQHGVERKKTFDYIIEMLKNYTKYVITARV